MKKALIASGLLTLAMLPIPSFADVLMIDAIAEAAPNSPDGLPRPTRSMKMTTVKEKYGEPLQEHSQVGEPPITRWDYDGYSVFFEYDQVLTTVVHR